MTENLNITVNASFGSEYQKQLATHALRLSLMSIKQDWEEKDSRTKIEISYGYPRKNYEEA